MIKSAQFSPCRRYRYELWRQWDDAYADRSAGYAMFVGLNPSTADEVEDDPTVRRCIAYARDWGYGALCMTNIFAFRSTDPANMLAQQDPVGPDNDAALVRLAQNAAVVVAAWGTHGSHRDRDQAVKLLLPKLHHLRKTKEGHPGHPLYLPKTLMPMPF